MGIPRDHAVGAIRLSLGRDTTAEEIARAAEVLSGLVEKGRKLAVSLGRSG
jgi:cysteine sulfinate desulfinase/cysteine desulfurase-like protein